MGENSAPVWVSVFRNGFSVGGILCVLPDDKNMMQFRKDVQRRMRLHSDDYVTGFFSKDGIELRDLLSVEDGDKLYITCGDPFLNPNVRVPPKECIFYREDDEANFNYVHSKDDVLTKEDLMERLKEEFMDFKVSRILKQDGSTLGPEDTVQAPSNIRLLGRPTFFSRSIGSFGGSTNSPASPLQSPSGNMSLMDILHMNPAADEKNINKEGVDDLDFDGEGGWDQVGLTGTSTEVISNTIKATKRRLSFGRKAPKEDEALGAYLESGSTENYEKRLLSAQKACEAIKKSDSNDEEIMKESFSKVFSSSIASKFFESFLRAGSNETIQKYRFYRKIDDRIGNFAEAFSIYNEFFKGKINLDVSNEAMETLEMKFQNYEEEDDEPLEHLFEECLAEVITYLAKNALNNFVSSSSYSLLNSSLILNRKDFLKTGSTILHSAVAQGKTDTVKGLIGLDNPVDVQNLDGDTPLHLAVLHDNKAMCELLVDCKGFKEALKIQNKNGAMPLRLSVNRGSAKITAFLLKYATPKEVGFEGKIPMSAARTKSMRSLLGSKIWKK